MSAVASKKKAKGSAPSTTGGAGSKAYQFRVQLLGGPLSEVFIKENPVPPYRIIEASGANMLDDLHEAIFSAFDFYEEHMYEFQIGGRDPDARKAVHYVHPYCDDIDEEKYFYATEVTIDSLNLGVGKKFFYNFDFGDSWWHIIKLVRILPAEPDAKYPRVIKTYGESPSQYWMDDYPEEDLDGDENKCCYVQTNRKCLDMTDEQLDELAKKVEAERKK